MPIQEYCGEQHVKDINGLIAKSFGRRMRGDIYVNDFINSAFVVMSHNNRLSGIGFPARKIAYFFNHHPCVSAGRFNSEDGSKLEVKEKYFSKALKYARLYEERFGKRVEISVNDNTRILVNCYS